MSRHQLASEGASFLADFFLAVALGLASVPCTVNLYLAGKGAI
jgi:cytochrome c biogenesis protein CcdA